MSEEAKDAPRTVPRGVGLTVIAVLALYACAADRPLGDAGSSRRGRRLLDRPRDEVRGRPGAGIVENLGLSSGLTNILRYYVGVWRQ